MESEEEEEETPSPNSEVMVKADLRVGSGAGTKLAPVPTGEARLGNAPTPVTADMSCSRAFCSAAMVRAMFAPPSGRFARKVLYTFCWAVMRASTSASDKCAYAVKHTVL